MKTVLKPLSVLVLALAAAGAQAIPMSDLLGGQTLTVNDKVFADWEVTFLDMSNPNQAEPDYSLIEVTGLDNDPNNPGIRFELNGQLDVTGVDQDGDWVDWTFNFSVATANGAALIKDVSMDLTGVAFEGDEGMVGIVETVTDMNDALLADIDVLSDNAGWEEDKLQDGANFATQSKIFVEKNVLVATDAAGEMASLESFEQRFSQKVEQAPEPGLLVLLGLGLAGFGFARRRA